MGSQGATGHVRQIPEYELVLLTPKVGILEKRCEIQVIRNCEEWLYLVKHWKGQFIIGFNGTI